MKKLFIKTEYITLDAALKFANIASTGGEAKILISEERVKVNGELCIQRGKKLRPGDGFDFDGAGYEVARRPTALKLKN